MRRSGDLLIETPHIYPTKYFLLAKTFLDSPVSICPHKSLNTCRGVISEPDLLTIPDAEIVEGFSDQAHLLPSTSTLSEIQPPIPTFNSNVPLYLADQAIVKKSRKQLLPKYTVKQVPSSSNFQN
ncbi:hypothetical protein TNCV_1449581 [Trichonephila clavipes]|nr:hypothetical protein TNCV_1449581 [Trichonephila clavipes]